MAIEPYEGMTVCSSDMGACDLESVCVISEKWHAIDEAIFSALASVNLSDMLSPDREIKIDVSQIKKLKNTKNIKECAHE